MTWDATFQPLDPATREALPQVVPSTAEEVENKARAAGEALASWSADGRLRSRVLAAWAHALRESVGELVSQVVAETGKPVGEARAEIAGAADALDYNAGLARQPDGRATTLHDGARSHLVRVPVGVSAFIVPWNWPVLLLLRDLAPALAAGVTAVVKPASQTANITRRVLEIGTHAGIPDGVVDLVYGETAVGGHLLRQPAVRAVAFTGSTDVGREILRASAGRMLRPLLELGGKNAAIVFEDVDLETVLPRLARASVITAGQMCMALSRLLVPRALRAEAVRIVSATLDGLHVGHPGDEATGLGPLISDAHADRVAAVIEQARERYPVIGGEPVTPAGLEGRFLRPAVVDGPPADAPVVQTDVFGPVLTVESFDDEEHAVRLANTTEYGLVGAVWSRDQDRAWRVSHAMEAGTVWVNGWGVTYAEVPAGGFKASGLGRTRGVEGVRQFTELKHVHFSPVN
ncbi:aldehyde dehydrogenase family protein [Streptomyces sp. NPDC051956]|uniref:aldehyde dehydrogenase family protein n=1 Tax=Streptomyces sp. NPDC051956 TaxID=3365677 RepID=UPI0037D43389